MITRGDMALRAKTFRFNYQDNCIGSLPSTRHGATRAIMQVCFGCVSLLVYLNEIFDYSAQQVRQVVNYLKKGEVIKSMLFLFHSKTM